MLASVHRQETLNNPTWFREAVCAIRELSYLVPVVLLGYRSTVASVRSMGLEELGKAIVVDTCSYHDYLGLISWAKAVVTDSSGLQDESSFLGVPCVTFRRRTHRVDTVEFGGNEVVGYDRRAIVKATIRRLSGELNQGILPDVWYTDAGAAFARFFQIVLPAKTNLAE